MNLRNKIGQFRERQIFEKRYKLPSWTIKTVIIAYALFGGYTVFTILKTETVKFFEPKTIIVTPQAKAELEAEEEIEIVDCLTALDYWTKEYGIEGQRETLKKLIQAESSNNPLAENPNSTAKGCSQFIHGTWTSQGKAFFKDDFYKMNIYNPSDNIRLLVAMIAENPQNISHWDASKHLWQ